MKTTSSGYYAMPISSTILSIFAHFAVLFSRSATKKILTFFRGNEVNFLLFRLFACLKGPSKTE